MGVTTDLHAYVKFPNEAFGLIVAKLSLMYMFQLRLVCKQWNALLHDIDFVEEHLRLTKHDSMYVWRTKEGYAAYSPESNSWQMLPKSFFLMEESWYKISSGANGLLLVESQVDSEIAFYVSNPMTRSFKKLPETRDDGRTDRVVTRSYGRLLNVQEAWPTDIIFDGNSQSYKIFGEYSIDYLNGYYKIFWGKSSYRVVMYDLERESWKCYGGWGGADTYFGISTLHRGVLHCILTDYDIDVNLDLRKRRHNVFRFNNDGSQSHLLCTSKPIYKDMLFVHMFEWKGNLLLVGGKRLDEHCVWTVKFWQLDKQVDDETIPGPLRTESKHKTMPAIWQPEGERNVWTETVTMPDDILFRFSPEDPDEDPTLHLQFSCSNSGDYVYFTSYSEDSLFARHVVYDLSKSSWWELPELLPSYQQSNKSDSTGCFGSFLWKPSFERPF